MAEIVWNIPSEGQILDRLEELNTYLENFPNSKLSPIVRKEVAYLESLL